MSSLTYEATVIKDRSIFYMIFFFSISYACIEEMVHNVSAVYLPSYVTFKNLLLHTKGLGH